VKKITEFEVKQGIVCITFLCNTAKAYVVINDHYNNTNIVAVCAHVMNNPQVFPVFNAISTDNCKLELQKWFPDVEEQIKADIKTDLFAVAFADFLLKAVDKCLCIPLCKYLDTKTWTSKITALRKLNASVLVTQKTEATVMQVDQEITISSKLVDQLISERVKKEVQKTLKNTTQGAQSASLKNKNKTSTNNLNQTKNSSKPHPNKPNGNSKGSTTELILRKPSNTTRRENSTLGKNKGSKSGTKQTPSSKNVSKQNAPSKNAGRNIRFAKQQS